MSAAERPTPHRTPPTWLLAIGFWTIFGVISAAQAYVRDSTSGKHASVASVANIVWFYWAWAVVTPFVLRFQHDPARTPRGWATLVTSHVPRLVAVLAVQETLYALFLVIGDRVAVGELANEIPLGVVRHLAGNVATYVGIVGAAAAFAAYRRAHDARLEASRLALHASELETALVTARLDALRAQLQPHFLFNTLNMVAAFVTKQDPVTANRVLARLGDLLRAVLAAPATQESALADELRLTRDYLEIAQLRFGDRLTIAEHVEDDTLDLAVPTLLLQPLVENAVRHGVAARDGDARIEIAAYRNEGALVLEVRDDGPGFDTPTIDPGNGVGLAQARIRVEQLYAGSGRLTTSEAPGGGAVVTVRIPARRHA